MVSASNTHHISFLLVIQKGPRMQPPDVSNDSQLEHELSPNPQNLSENDPNVARDPVCGVLVDKRTVQNTLSVNAPTQQTLYFHSAQCKTIFEQNPEQFGYHL
jgi:YHS domain-containing protein